MKSKTEVTRLWAPWRLEHIQAASKKNREKSKDCVFCDLVKAKCNEKSLKLYQSKHCFVVMNRFPYNPNHLLVIPNDHLAMMQDLSGKIWADLSSCVKATSDLLMDLVKPQGLNIGLNMGKAGGASIAAHLHFHILPRWEGDTNFMPLLAETKSLPVHNVTVFRNLEGHFKHFKKYLP